MHPSGSLFVTIAVTLFLSFAQPSSSEQTRPISFQLKAGQEVVVPGTDIHLSVKKIRDLASTGCLGGPVGCGIQVFLEFTREKEKRELLLRYAAQAVSRKNETEKSVVFNYRIILEKVTPKQVDLILIREREY